jgi:hypothetical protein
MVFARFAYLLPQIAEQTVKDTHRHHISALMPWAFTLGSGVGLATISPKPADFRVNWKVGASSFVNRLCPGGAHWNNGRSPEMKRPTKNDCKGINTY